MNFIFCDVFSKALFKVVDKNTGRMYKKHVFKESTQQALFFKNKSS